MNSPIVGQAMPVYLLQTSQDPTTQLAHLRSEFKGTDRQFEKFLKRRIKELETKGGDKKKEDDKKKRPVSDYVLLWAILTIVSIPYGAFLMFTIKAAGIAFKAAMQ